ncbi:hypothetical protein F7725_027867 [Dissostichus mawsoni]|uniref:Uncharacterized protein n=1 Tax=Dissostichus mawsoni TaxID=36200 RepID=A0A7J5XF51_DISMA|nr:hypothetical protein F7725_027867 [Dissostichus mawsoni]
MSIPNLSEESSKRLKGRARLQSNADRRGADPSEGLTTCSIVHEHPARKFTEEEMDIHRAHREACETKKQMYVDPSSGYKVFTEYAQLQRGKCCGSACRHQPSPPDSQLSLLATLGSSSAPCGCSPELQPNELLGPPIPALQ